MAEIKRTTWDSLSEMRAQKLAFFFPLLCHSPHSPTPPTSKWPNSPQSPPTSPFPPSNPTILFLRSHCRGPLNGAQYLHSESLVWVKSLIHSYPPPAPSAEPQFRPHKTKQNQPIELMAAVEGPPSTLLPQGLQPRQPLFSKVPSLPAPSFCWIFVVNKCTLLLLCPLSYLFPFRTDLHFCQRQPTHPLTF